MKRIISLLLLAMVTVVLFSCGGPYPEPVEQEIPFEELGHVLGEDPAEDEMFVFNTREEFEAYYAEHPGNFYSDYLTTCSYDAAYFETHTLVGLHASLYDHANRVVKKGNQFTFELFHKYVITATPPYGSSYLLIEVDANSGVTVSNSKIVYLKDTE